MSLFSKVPVHCNNCGNLFETSFHEYDGRVCCKACNEEMNKKRTASIMGVTSKHMKFGFKPKSVENKQHA